MLLPADNVIENAISLTYASTAVAINMIKYLPRLQTCYCTSIYVGHTSLGKILSINKTAWTTKESKDKAGIIMISVALPDFNQIYYYLWYLSTLYVVYRNSFNLQNHSS